MACKKINPTKWQKIIFTYALINLCLGLLYLLPFYAYNTLSLWKITGNDNSIFDLNSSNYFLAFSLLYLALFLCLVGGLVIVLALRKFFSWPAMILFLSPLQTIKIDTAAIFSATRKRFLVYTLFNSPFNYSNKDFHWGEKILFAEGWRTCSLKPFFAHSFVLISY